MANRLTKFEKSPNSVFPYKLNDESLCTELDSIHKLGMLEDLEESLGCPLEVVFKALKQSNSKGLFINTKDNDGVKWKGFIKCYLMYDSFNEKFYWTNGYFAEYLENYKKNWWLKEDKSE